jgi:hypothetical protein
LGFSFDDGRARGWTRLLGHIDVVGMGTLGGKRAKSRVGDDRSAGIGRADNYAKAVVADLIDAVAWGLAWSRRFVVIRTLLDSSSRRRADAGSSGNRVEIGTTG